MAKNKGGRPTKLSPESILKLEQVFAMDGTVLEACFFADIGTSTYYEWITNNPKLADRFEALRQTPILKARQTIFKDLGDTATAKWYLEKKRRNEFASKSIQEHEGEVTKNLKVSDEEGEALARKFEEAYKKNILGL